MKCGHALAWIVGGSWRAILGLSWRFPAVAIRGDMGWAKLKYGRHCKVLKFMARVRGMGLEHWPRIVAEALADV